MVEAFPWILFCIFLMYLYSTLLYSHAASGQFWAFSRRTRFGSRLQPCRLVLGGMVQVQNERHGRRPRQRPRWHI
ncbi:hypothetical protein DFJ77DRAFT_480729 [Powellomyces hirtus]|nr:hypothetical protein DFJ77DRAFT_480729 [Powellomyces hirtus]